MLGCATRPRCWHCQGRDIMCGVTSHTLEECRSFIQHFLAEEREKPLSVIRAVSGWRYGLKWTSASLTLRQAVQNNRPVIHVLIYFSILLVCEKKINIYIYMFVVPLCHMHFCELNLLAGFRCSWACAGGEERRRCLGIFLPCTIANGTNSFRLVSSHTHTHSCAQQDAQCSRWRNSHSYQGFL